MRRPLFPCAKHAACQGPPQARARSTSTSWRAAGASVASIRRSCAGRCGPVELVPAAQAERRRAGRACQSRQAARLCSANLLARGNVASTGAEERGNSFSASSRPAAVASPSMTSAWASAATASSKAVFTSRRRWLTRSASAVRRRCRSVPRRGGRGGALHSCLVLARLNGAEGAAKTSYAAPSALTPKALADFGRLVQLDFRVLHSLSGAAASQSGSCRFVTD
jgi:hypothetical protein